MQESMRDQNAARERLATTLKGVDEQAVRDYSEFIPLLVKAVNRALCEQEDFAFFCDGNDPDLLFSNHENHAVFMQSQLALQSAPTILETMRWAYRAYMARGVPAAYFEFELKAWREAVEEYLPRRSAAQVIAVYDCMLGEHAACAEQATEELHAPRVEAALRESYEQFLQALLAPDVRRAIRVAEEAVRNPQDIRRWWTGVIQPAMYEVGARWAQGKIHVGQEHMATSIAQRVMSIFYPRILEFPRDKGRLIVAASPGELHEIGPRMLSDILEMSGWDVDYCGASTPRESIVEMMRAQEPDALLVSTTLTSNLMQTRRMVGSLREALPDMRARLIVGGQAYGLDPDIWETIGADHFAGDADTVLELLQHRA